MDGDTISPTNCVRQPFARSEIGLNKAIVLVNRLNLFWGLKWEAVPVHLQAGMVISRSYSGGDLRAYIVIGCVDTRTARATIRDAVSKWSTVSYWLDLGNNANTGQFILGEPPNQRNHRAKLRPRTAPSFTLNLLTRTSTMTENQAVARLRPLSEIPIRQLDSRSARAGLTGPAIS